MGPKRPYLLRANYDWLLDNECTPHLIVNATMTGVRVPVEHIKDGQIILNIAPYSVGNFEISNERVTFSARFGGKPYQLVIPMAAVIAIYARENGAGTMFEDDDFYLQQAEEELVDQDAVNVASEILDDVVTAIPVKKDRSFLSVVK
jgi:stringent starvation protein B